MSPHQPVSVEPSIAALVAALPHASVVLGPAGELLLANHRARVLFGWGSTLPAHMPAGDLAGLPAARAGLLRLVEAAMVEARVAEANRALAQNAAAAAAAHVGAADADTARVSAAEAGPQADNRTAQPSHSPQLPESPGDTKPAPSVSSPSGTSAAASIAHLAAVVGSLPAGQRDRTAEASASAGASLAADAGAGPNAGAQATADATAGPDSSTLSPDHRRPPADAEAKTRFRHQRQSSAVHDDTQLPSAAAATGQPSRKKGRRGHRHWQVHVAPFHLDASTLGYLVQIDRVPVAYGIEHLNSPLRIGMTGAFCVVKVEYAAGGRARDLRIQEANDAFLEYVGSRDARGRSLRELRRGAPPDWLHLCATVARTGRQCLLRDAVHWGERWFDVLLFRTSDTVQHEVAVVFQDATERAENARRLLRSQRAARQAADEAQVARRRLEATLAALPVGVYMIDAEGYVLHTNPEASRLWGVREPVRGTLASYAHWTGWWADQSERHGQPLKLADWPMMRALEGAICRDVIEIETLDQPPQRRIVELSAAPIRAADGHIEGAVAAVMDLSARVHAENELRRSTERYSKIVHQAATGVMEVDAEGRISLVNRRFCELLRYAENELIGRPVIEITAPDSVPDMQAAVASLQAGGPDYITEKRYRRSDGTILWATSSVSALRDEQGHYQGRVVIIVDISRQKQAEEQLRHASLHDGLTGLPNRAMLYEYATHQLSHNRRARQPAAVLFLDLDRFKPINDTHGHEIGDQVLKKVADRLVASTRAEDLVVRLGGDEFVILLQDIRDAVYAAEVANHLIERINEPYQVGELSLTLSTSIGISMFPEDAPDIDALVSHADMAMYQAKQAGRNNFQFYSVECSVRSRLQLWIEDRLRATLRQRQFHLVYQPVLDVASETVVSVEALLRWGDANIGPERFVPVAEATGIINPISRWLLGEASRQHKLWHAHGLPPIPIAVNVSVVEFRDRGFADRVESALAEQGVSADALQLELTETAVMDDVDHAVAVLSRLKQHGIKILLDDFGTGHSSLSQLVRLPLNKVKIDRSFVLPLVTDDVASSAVTSAMISLAITLGLEVVAEGVESERAYRFVSEHGCTQAQGFYIGEPMSPLEFEHWYRGHQAALDCSRRSRRAPS